MPETLKKVDVRPAQPKDQPAVLAFCQGTWDWGDYIGDVWETWLADTVGVLLVAVVDGQPAGVGKVTMPSKAEAWFEGLRVNPAFRGCGVAQALYHGAEREAVRRGARVARYATYSDNQAVHKLSERYGYQRVASLIEYTAPGQPGPLPAHLLPEEANEAEKLLAESAGLTAAGGLYSGGWHCQELRGGRLREHILRGEAYVVRRQGQPIALALISGRDPREGLRVGFLGGQGGAVSTLAGQLRALEDPASQVFVDLPALEELQQAVRAAGYRPNWNKELWIYERQLSRRGRGH